MIDLLLAVIFLAVILYREERSQELNAKVIRLSEQLAEQAAEDRAAAQAERRDLANRIQAPEAAPFMGPSENGVKNFVTADDDDDFWESVGEQEG